MNIKAMRNRLTHVFIVITPVDPTNYLIKSDPNAFLNWKWELFVSSSILCLCHSSIPAPHGRDGTFAAVWKYFLNSAFCPNTLTALLVLVALCIGDRCNNATPELIDNLAVVETLGTVDVGSPCRLICLMSYGKLFIITTAVLTKVG